MPPMPSASSLASHWAKTRRNSASSPRSSPSLRGQCGYRIGLSHPAPVPVDQCQSAGVPLSSIRREDGQVGLGLARSSH